MSQRQLPFLMANMQSLREIQIRAKTYVLLLLLKNILFLMKKQMNRTILMEKRLRINIFKRIKYMHFLLYNIVCADTNNSWVPVVRDKSKSITEGVLKTLIKYFILNNFLLYYILLCLKIFIKNI